LIGRLASDEEKRMNHASCLCARITWEIDGPFELMHHCHCSRCRKAHGVPFATYVAGPAAGFRLSGGEHMVRWESSPGFYRCFCGRCGSVVPGAPFDERVFVPAGNFIDDPGVHALAHIFVASKAPWYEIPDGLPRFDTYPEGIDAPVLPERDPLDPPGAPRGSCLCGRVTYVLEGTSLRSHNCHCSRCRKARSAAYAANLFTTADGVRFTRGENLLSSYKVPEALRFTHVFCRQCGSPMPRVDPDRGLTVVPMGSFDDDPGMRPQSHIFVASKAPWFDVADDLPQFAEYPAQL
jgi:hypothetical protein